MQHEVENQANNQNPLQTPLYESSIMSSSSGISYMAYSEQHRNENSVAAQIPDSNSVPVPRYVLAPRQHSFQPNSMVLKRMSTCFTQPAQGGANGNYLGNRSLASSTREVPGLPDQRNCALFLTHIPVEATLHDIFSVIKTGAVFCLHINPPTGIHPTKAAKVAFMTPEAAAAFLAQIQSFHGVVIHGKKIQGRYNRNGYVRNERSWQSRVLYLEGPTYMMGLDYWMSHFATFSEFELECYAFSPCQNNGRTKLELRFARIDGQAQTCLQCIKSDPSLEGKVQVSYGTDPCGSSQA
jgi:hypothetical protein